MGNLTRDMTNPKIAVVIPCYRVSRHILEVLSGIHSSCDAIYLVDDCCPEGTADLVEGQVTDPRLTVIRNEVNLGVGGATLEGMNRALADGATVMVKLDGDGQMDPALMPRLIAPILRGDFDYAKGNRFFHLRDLAGMPLVRKVGNAVLSFVTKLSSGYWQIFDPTNGYIAIHSVAFRQLPQSAIDRRYFFETDMLFQLNLLRATVIDIPMQAIYRNESSNLHIANNAFYFARRHTQIFIKRIVYSYFIRDFNMASIYLVLSIPLLAFGLIFGTERWIGLAERGVAATAGTVMLASLPVLLGSQMLLSFLAYDIANVPRQPLQRLLDGSEID